MSVCVPVTRCLGSGVSALRCARRCLRCLGTPCACAICTVSAVACVLGVRITALAGFSPLRAPSLRGSAIFQSGRNVATCCAPWLGAGTVSFAIGCAATMRGSLLLPRLRTPSVTAPAPKWTGVDSMLEAVVLVSYRARGGASTNEKRKAYVMRVKRLRSSFYGCGAGSKH